MTNCHLIIATYACAFVFDIQNEYFESLLQGDGLYYGSITTEHDGYKNMMVETVARPTGEVFNSATGQEWLIQWNASTGEVSDRIPIPSVFTHGAIYVNETLWLTSTQNGNIYGLNRQGYTLQNNLSHIFNKTHHINTIAYDENVDRFYVLAHAYGLSFLVEFSTTWEITDVFRRIGINAHEIVFWKEDILYLDSSRGQLCSINRRSKRKTVRWTSSKRNAFLKGLKVTKNHAIIGECEWGSRVERHTQACSLQIVPLTFRSEAKRIQLPNTGLINSIGTFGSKSFRMDHLMPMSCFRSTNVVTELVSEHVLTLLNRLKGDTTIDPFAQLSRHFILARKEDNEKTHSQVLQYWFLLSDHQMSTVYEFAHSSPLIDVIYELIKPWHTGLQNTTQQIIRLQIADLLPGGIVPLHTDGGIWAKTSRRIHIPLFGVDQVEFRINGYTYHPRIGQAFTFENNVYQHTIINQSPTSTRRHLILDLLESTQPINQEKIFEIPANMGYKAGKLKRRYQTIVVS